MTDGSFRPLPLPIAILVQPRRTMRRILDDGGAIAPAIAMLLVAFVSASLADFDLRAMREILANLGMLVSVVGAIAILLLGACLWVGMFSLVAWLALLTGRMLGGVATYREAWLALAWGTAPGAWALLYRIPAMIFWNESWKAVHGEAPFIRVADTVAFQVPSPEASCSAVMVLGLLDLVVVAAYFFVAGRALAEAQRINSWAGLGNLVLAFVAPVLVILVIALSVFLTGWSMK